MKFPKFFINAIKKDVLSSMNDQEIHVESAIRGSKKTKMKSGEIKRSNALFTPQTIRDWNLAVSAATDAEDPTLVHLAELYQNILLDNHLVSVIENRIYRVLQSNFFFKGADNEENDDIKVLFESVWFEKFVKSILWTKFTGVKVLEIAQLDDDLQLSKIVDIPMAHLKPQKGIFTKEEGDDNGWPYKEGALKRFYMQIGEDYDLGILADVAPMILGKKLALGAWLDYVQKFGIPPRWVTTDREDTTRLDELFEMMQDMVNSHFAVLRGEERIEIAPTPGTDAHQVFNELISRINSEISKRILGQDGTSDHKESSGTYGSLKVLQGVADDRHESDKLFVKYVINKLLIPHLISLSSAYAPLANHTFEWDNSEELTSDEFIKNVVNLTNAGFQLDPEQIQERTGLTILGQNLSKEEEEEEEEDNKPKSKKTKGSNAAKKKRVNPTK